MLVKRFCHIEVKVSARVPNFVTLMIAEAMGRLLLVCSLVRMFLVFGARVVL
jgi:hypothetical protein